mgnify:CR=1 FL=1
MNKKLCEIFEKAQEYMETEEFKENAIEKIKEYININFADIKTIALGDKIYIIPKEDTPIKIIFKEWCYVYIWKSYRWQFIYIIK